MAGRLRAWPEDNVAVMEAAGRVPDDHAVRSYWQAKRHGMNHK